MLKEIGSGAWIVDSGAPGSRVCLSFGVHGNERAPIDAGKRLVERFECGELSLTSGSVLFVFANPRAAEENQRWSDGGVDLNRCFHASVLAREPALHEEKRAHEIIRFLESFEPEVLVDFHCTVEPGDRFMIHHPCADDPAHAQVTALLEAGVILADPELRFGGVSLDEWMSTRGRVGICYETGWMGDPANTPEAVYAEMVNVLAGSGMLDGREGNSYPEKRRLELFSAVTCDGKDFIWDPGIGENLQPLAAGTRLGAYGDEREVVIGEDATLVFPKKRPELVERGKPLVLLARETNGGSGSQ